MEATAEPATFGRATSGGGGSHCPPSGVADGHAGGAGGVGAVGVGVGVGAVAPDPPRRPGQAGLSSGVCAGVCVGTGSFAAGGRDGGRTPSGIGFPQGSRGTSASVTHPRVPVAHQAQDGGAESGDDEDHDGVGGVDSTGTFGGQGGGGQHHEHGVAQHIGPRQRERSG